MCPNKKLRQRSLLNKQSWKHQSAKHSVHLNQFTKGRCSVRSVLQHQSADIATPGRLGPGCLRRGTLPEQVSWKGFLCPPGCATPVSGGLKLPLACERIYEQNYLHCSVHAKWHDRLSFLGSANPGLAEAEIKAIQSWLEMPHFPEIPNWEVEKRPFGFEAVLWWFQASLCCMKDWVITVCSSIANMSHSCCPASARVFH